ncbi:hypothetical protein GPJ56_001421 [Histomonas meleagridis]|uniref:uncharacterized protein n=1 Tax=Histomonas meleagridis TaxID=135588 RepID=UPI00355A66B9|nr:hypothetical protein GPJ56_001421 [Histomonas meleagridis]KAH0798181.1 hypothetical protein GO595_009027 [Histomonas meleagridis]
MIPEDAGGFPPRVTPFTIFISRNRERTAIENPNLTPVMISQKLAAEWASYTPEQRALYNEESSYSFEEPYKQKQNEYNPLCEAVINAANDISTLPQPTDMASYVNWLGAQIVSQYYSTHGCLPPELIENLQKGTFMSQPPSDLMKNIINQASQNQ